MKNTEQTGTVEMPVKTKVSYAKLYVTRGGEKPYYGIEYHSIEDDTIHCGFGSYNIEYVKEWLVECFDFIYHQSSDQKERV